MVEKVRNTCWHVLRIFKILLFILQLGDNKNCETCKETLYIIGSVLDVAFVSKSPKVKSEALNWAGEGIKMFGFGGLQPKPALDCIKKGLAETNPAVRTSSIQVLTSSRFYSIIGSIVLWVVLAPVTLSSGGRATLAPL